MFIIAGYRAVTNESAWRMTKERVMSDSHESFIASVRSDCRAELEKCGFYSYGLSADQEESVLNAAMSIAIDAATHSSMSFDYSRLALAAALNLK
jgi:hypothetical protein